MGKIYVGQFFKITLNLGTDITGWSNVKVRSKKPNGETVDYSTIILDEQTGQIQAQIQSTDNTKSGIWINWGIGTTADTKPMIGEPFSFKVYNEGN